MNAKPVKRTDVELVSDNANKSMPFRFVQAKSDRRMFCGQRFPNREEALKFLERANNQSDDVQYVLTEPKKGR